MAVLELAEDPFDLGVGQEAAARHISVVDSDLFLEVHQVIEGWSQAIGPASYGANA